MAIWYNVYMKNFYSHINNIVLLIVVFAFAALLFGGVVSVEARRVSDNLYGREMAKCEDQTIENNYF